MNKKIFRQAALDHISKPQELNQLIRIINLNYWIALGVIGVIFVAILIWAIMGTIPIIVNGEGILVKTGGILAIRAPASGLIIDITPKVGDIVQKGDIIAVVNQPELVQEIQLLKQELQEKKSRYHREFNQYRFELDNLELKLELLQKKLEISSKIISPYTGKIMGRMVREGELINTGMMIVNLELVQDRPSELVALLYINPKDGKKIKSGMLAEISPSTVKREEYGFLKGIVYSVSDLPVTEEEMMKVLNNPALVQTLSGGMSPIEVRVDLLKSKNSKNGYLWSSSGAVDINLNSGTLCDIGVIIESKHPIRFLIPAVRAKLGL